MLAPEGEHYNYSGCGNTFNCNHPQVRRFILDCLRYWVLEMHVDGFRFDLASIMTRAPSVWHRDADGDAATLHCAEPPALAAAAATAAPVPARSPLASADAPPKTPPDPLRGEQQYAPLQLPFYFCEKAGSTDRGQGMATYVKVCLYRAVLWQT